MDANDEFPYEAPLRNGIARIVEQALGWTDPAATLNPYTPDRSQIW